METLTHVNWRDIFVPHVSLIELVVRGTLMYFFLLFLLRMRRKSIGGFGISNLLFVVVLADVGSTGFTGEYKSVSEGIFLLAVVAGWEYFFDWLSYRSRAFEKLIRPPAVLLIKNGQVDRRRVRQEFMTSTELREQLREQGIESLDEVKECWLEGNGNMSVIKRTPDNDGGPKKKPVGLK